MKIAIIGNPGKYIMAAVATRLVELARAHGATIVADTDLADVLRDVCPLENNLQSCDVAIALGGDGTVLKAVHSAGFSGVPVLGINLGTLGFLAEIPVEEMDDAVAKIVRGEMIREERTWMIATMEGSAIEHRALNEIVIDKRGASRMIQLDVAVDGLALNTYIADGLIVATPTGSTAYSLSAGGPIVSPLAHDFVITPLAPHALTARPLVVPDSSVITITARADRGALGFAADGIDTPLDSPALIHLRRSTTTVTFLRRPGVSNYDVLRAKLLWGKDARGAASKEMFRKA